MFARCIIGVFRVRDTTMRKNLAERQAKMKAKLTAARETFRNCAFRRQCSEEKPSLDAEFCKRCSASTLAERIRRRR